MKRSDEAAELDNHGEIAYPLWPSGGTTKRGYVSDPAALRVAMELDLIKGGDWLHVARTYNANRPRKGGVVGRVFYIDRDDNNTSASGWRRVRYRIDGKSIRVDHESRDWVQNDDILGWKAKA